MPSSVRSSERPAGIAPGAAVDDGVEAPRPGLPAEVKIDLCRGIFAFLVVSAHAIDICRACHPDTFAALNPLLDQFIRFVPEDGFYWVMGFFVISGYCIHLSVDRLREAERFPLRTYLVARCSRILPLYYIALVFAIGAERLMADCRPFVLPNGVNPLVLLSQVFMLQNFTQTYGSFAASWSITNEFSYYLIYGVLACFALRRREWPAWIGMATCIAMASVMQVLYLTVARTPVVLSTGLLFGLGINWFMGVLVAVHGRSLVKSRAVRSASRCWFLILMSLPYLHVRWAMPNQAAFLASGVAFSMMLLRFLAADPADRRAPTPRWIASTAHVLGLASYPTYLFHCPVIMLIGSAALRWGILSDTWTMWALLTAVGIGSGILLGFVLERPIMAWRGAMLRRMKTASAPTLRRPAVPVLGLER
jgi:peptidoglycan/LPS O-acetylase OafA/YrhL